MFDFSGDTLPKKLTCLPPKNMATFAPKRKGSSPVSIHFQGLCTVSFKGKFNPDKGLINSPHIHGYHINPCTFAMLVSGRAYLDLLD